MAIELTLKRFQEAFEKRSQPLRVPPRILVAVAVGAVVMTLTGLFSGIHSQQKRGSEAQQRYGDAQALLALPPASTSELQSALDAAKSQLTYAQAVAAETIDVSSDTVTADIVRQAQGAGLAVKGVSRINPGTAKLGDASYGVDGVRVVVDGSPQQVVGFLAVMESASAALLPSLTSMAINDAGIAHAEIAFSAYTKAASPTAVAVATPKAKR